MTPERYFLVWSPYVFHDMMEHRINVTPKRQYRFVVDKVRHWPTESFQRWSKSWLLKNATLRILHDFKWWEYDPGRWRFGGKW